MFALLNQYYWHINNGYVDVKYRKKDGTLIIKRLHRLIFELIGLLTNDNKDLFVDHINGRKLDCRLVNLRLVTPRVNAQNRTKDLSKSSMYLGVSKSTKSNLKPWVESDPIHL